MIPCCGCPRDSVDGYFFLIRFCDVHRSDATAVRDAFLDAQWRRRPRPTRDALRTWEDMLFSYDPGAP